jgi:hypothetical protein
MTTLRESASLIPTNKIPVGRRLINEDVGRGIMRRWGIDIDFPVQDMWLDVSSGLRAGECAPLSALRYATQWDSCPRAFPPFNIPQAYVADKWLPIPHATITVSLELTATPAGDVAVTATFVDGLLVKFEEDQSPEVRVRLRMAYDDYLASLAMVDLDTSARDVQIRGDCGINHLILAGGLLDDEPYREASRIDVRDAICLAALCREEWLS